MTRRSLIAWPNLAVAAWIIGVAGGLAWLAQYAGTPGVATPAARTWPVESAIPREAGTSTLVLFLHPDCPCSRATLSELERALAWGTEATRLCVVFERRPGSETPSLGALRERVKNLAPSVVFDDALGAEARRFGAVTSGEVFVYNASGTLVFQGGVTPSRGHEGASDGRAAVTAILAGDRVQTAQAPVYGCPLCATAADEGGTR